MKYEIKLEAFEGPLDLLLHLIRVNEIDIYDIPIHRITDQYMEYMDIIDVTNMESTSEFLVMAATLLEIKSKMLLPTKDLENFSELFDSNDPRTDLVQKLLEYKKYKEASAFFKEREDIYGRIYYKEQEDLAVYAKELTVEELNSGLERELLVEAIKKVLFNLDKNDNHRSSFFQKLKKDNFTVDEKITCITDRITREDKFSFDSLFKGENLIKEEVIVTFLALLELLKLKVIRIKQDSIFNEIMIYKRVESDVAVNENVDVLN